MHSSFDVGLGGYKWIDSGRHGVCVYLYVYVCVFVVYWGCVSLSEVELKEELIEDHNTTCAVFVD